MQSAKRIAFITGAASGLGLATARRFAADGMTVVVADLRAPAASEAAAALPGAGHRGIAIDVADEASVARAFDVIETELGPVVVLACFAGILSTSAVPGRIPLVDATLADWDRVQAVNARGTFLCIREYARRRTARPVEHGRIVTVASLAGQVGGLQSGAAYSASKGAVLSLTKLAARELAPLGITANTIAPGPIDTPMLRATMPEGGDQKYGSLAQVPLGRIGLPQEIAAAAAYLASVDAAFVTGSTLDVNGGMRMQ